MAITIGCGSWADDDYVNVLYPRGLPPRQRLSVYAQWFDRVEVNSTYYATPRRDVIRGWAEQTPARFRFDLKLHRRFSQNPAAAAKGQNIKWFLAAIDPLIETDKLGALLLTLAPSFRPGRHQLDELDAIANKVRPIPLAVELRHRGWVEADELATTLDYFRERQLSWVALDLPRLNSPLLLPAIDEVTNPRLAYMRLHGRNRRYLQAKDAAARHHYDYRRADLKDIATRIQALAARAKRVHVSVNNHAEDFAPKAALTLRRLLGQRVRTGLPPLVSRKRARGTGMR